MNQQDMEMIERYLNDELTAEEKLQTEQRMSVDPEFKRRLEVFREYQQMHSKEQVSFRELLQEVEREYLQSKKPRKKYWLIAASVSTICLLAVVYFLFLNPSPQPEALYAQYFSPPADNLTVRGDQGRQLLNEAMALYNDQQFAEALQRFESWQGQHPDSIPVIFYSAMSHMALGDMQPAIVQLEQIGQSMESGPYKVAARWYLALAYLKNEKTGESRKILLDLAEGSSSYAAKAQQLLGEL
jgi:tetratricopeptide (TPR) repeat protein